MKIFQEDGERVNFVDDNNVFVGYELYQSCCERADWYVASAIMPYTYETDVKGLKETLPDLSAYNFDPVYFEEKEGIDALDEGRMAVFKLLAEGKPDLYLHIFNAHNGYYAHGFEVKHNGEVVRNGYL